jgi:hypothetical protein
MRYIRMINWKGCGRKYYDLCENSFDILMEEMMKTIRHLTQDSPFSTRIQTKGLLNESEAHCTTPLPIHLSQ